MSLAGVNLSLIGGHEAKKHGLTRGLLGSRLERPRGIARLLGAKEARVGEKAG